MARREQLDRFLFLDAEAIAAAVHRLDAQGTGAGVAQLLADAADVHVGAAPAVAGAGRAAEGAGNRVAMNELAGARCQEQQQLELAGRERERRVADAGRGAARVDRFTSRSRR